MNGLSSSNDPQEVHVCSNEVLEQYLLNDLKMD